MSLTLAQFRVRIAQALADTGNTNYSTGLLDESLRTALHEYSQAYPLTQDTVITLPGDGREIDLDEVTGLLNVTQVWWPYDSDSEAVETWPPNQITGFRLTWSDARPVLFLSSAGQAQPKTDDELRLWYTTLHTVQNLDSGEITSVSADHESNLVQGAAALAALSRALDRAEEFNLDPKTPITLLDWGNARRKEFLAWLDTLRTRSSRSAPPWANKGWSMDKWDTNT